MTICHTAADRYNFSSRLYFIYFIFVIFITPINLPGVRLLNEAIFILASIGSVLYILFYAAYHRLELDILYFGICSSLVFSILLFLNVPESFIEKDLIEVLKPVLYSIFVVAGYKLGKAFCYKDIQKGILVMAVLSILFSMFVLFPPLHFIADLYKGRISTSSYNFHFFRFSGTLGYPGAFGVWLVLPVLISISLYVRREISLGRFLIFFAFLLYGVLMTGSRAAIVVLGIAFLLHLVAYVNTKRGVLIFSIFSLSVIISVPLLINFSSSFQAFYYIVSTFDSGLENSFNYRLGELDRLLNIFLNGDVFGRGPDNSYLQSNYGPIESAYYYYGYKYGFIGLFYYFSLAIFFASMYVLSNKMHPLGDGCREICVFSIVALCIGGISNSITEEYKSFYMFFTLFGLCIYLFKSSKGVSEAVPF